VGSLFQLNFIPYIYRKVLHLKVLKNKARFLLLAASCSCGHHGCAATTAVKKRLGCVGVNMGEIGLEGE